MIDNKISPHYTMNVQNIYLSSKPHYEILDGLRGVAAAMVVAFHLLEAHSGGNHLNQIINHGYLAVDFFFMLSGFVIGYAYDDRWNRMSMGTFFKRRLIRLQPMVAMGSIVGAALFWFQKAPCYPAMEGVSIGALLLVMLLGCTLLPLPLKWDIRGWMEMHPLNGPAWSLYYEYIGNILYALFIRKFSKTALAVFVAIAACFTVHRCLTAPAGDIVGGWALNWEQQYVGAGSADVPVLWRTAPVAARLADTHPQERFLVVQPDDYRRAFRAPYRRGGRLLDERALRGFLHHLHFPGHCFDGCGRQDNGQAFHCRMQVFGRHILSCLYHPLSASLYLYGVGLQPSGDACRRPSLHAAHFRRGLRACLCLSEVLRPPGAQVAYGAFF